MQFIVEHKSEPFFLYLAHSLAHVPLFRSEAFAGVSERGLYGGKGTTWEGGAWPRWSHLETASSTAEISCRD